MQIIIPMSGFGERFRRAGYTLPKPLIEVDQKPIIGHVIDLFPGEKNVIFICNREHLENLDYQLENTLKKYCPTAQIISIEPHHLGPVHAVLQAEQWIDRDQPAIINYCDFTCRWNWEEFIQFTHETQCKGAIPAYKGFHPHCLGSTNYAYMKEHNGWVMDIQEKQPYTQNRMEEYASSGTYYFASGELLFTALKTMQAENLKVNNEYYVSMAYKPLLAKGLPIAVYPLEHFMQWGTPEDLKEYCFYSKIFKDLATYPLPHTGKASGTVIIPMAGLGKRFAVEGYPLTKPLIPVSGLPMLIQAVRDLPVARQYVFVLREDMPEITMTIKIIKQYFPQALIETVPEVTEGQACTARIGLNALSEVKEPITFGTCDNGALYHQEQLDALLETADVIVWTKRGHPHAARHPHQYSWVNTDDTHQITSISIKAPLKDPTSDPIVIGTFTFKRKTDFLACMESMQTRQAKINNEYYLDTCIHDAIVLGLDCRAFEIEDYLGWGTPNDLKTFEYWQSCFHQWLSHPYSMDQDVRVLVNQGK